MISYVREFIERVRLLAHPFENRCVGAYLQQSTDLLDMDAPCGSFSAYVACHNL